ncbi:MAG: EAL domain-containing protein [Methylococcales bacterium]|nr:EAL domain-containing protein [Methylococcales bacterium]
MMSGTLVPVQVLLIEDDLADQMSFKRLVKRQQLPYQYQIAGSVAEAKTLLQQQAFDIILADHALGDGTFFDLVEYIPQATPFIFVTGSGNEAVAVKALKLGAADYLTKDIHGEYLNLIPLTVDSVLKVRANEMELVKYRQKLEQMVAVRTQSLHEEIDRRQQLEARLIQEKQRAQVTLQSIADGVVVASLQGEIEFINTAAEKLSGWTLADAKGHHVDTVFCIIDEHTRQPVANSIAQCLQQRSPITSTCHAMLIDKGGKEYAIHDSIAPIHDDCGELCGVVLVFSDVSHAQRLSRQLAYQAAHDPLTGLVNRHELETRLQGVLARRQHDQDAYAFCYLDLDQFKVVNDTCGHSAGDELLKQITALLQARVRKRDTLARLGGDEFGVLMECCELEQAKRLANDLREVIADYRFNWQQQSFRIGVSIGLIEITEEFNSLSDLLMVADAACYAAKDAGRNRVYIYQKDSQEIQRLSGQMQWVVKLHEAFDHQRFTLYRQPIHSIAQGEGLHYEILLRIVNADGKLVPPGAFIPAAERYGLMSRIDAWVIEQTFLWLAEHPEALAELAVCSINLSGQTLSHDSLQSDINTLIKRYALPAERFCFEITETAAIANLNQATRFMCAMKTLGFQFALDDFGSGLSSFAYLRNLPVDYLKIDGMFVKDIGTDPVDLAMVRSINEIGHLLGKQTIAEFVENAAIYQQLVDLGVDYAQGYYLGRPEPLSA